MSTKEQYLAYCQRQAENFASFPEDVKAKMMALNAEEGHEERKKELHDKFFNESDVDGDGMLSRDEHFAYVCRWRDQIREKFGDHVPFDEQLQRDAFDVMLITGKEGITQADFDQAMAWNKEHWAALIAQNK